jgi:hypothetical protein
MPGGGHAKLKRSLLLRDFLAYDIGFRLKDAERGLEAAETEQGAADAFSGGAFLDAVTASVTRAAARDRLQELDGVVRDVCRKTRFAARYPQYLALLLMGHVQRRLVDDEHQLLADANDFKRAVWNKQAPGRTESRERESIADFAAADFQLFAFWMATGAGKTHVLHACVALLNSKHYVNGRGFNRIVLI